MGGKTANVISITSPVMGVFFIVRLLGGVHPFLHAFNNGVSILLHPPGPSGKVPSIKGH